MDEAGTWVHQLAQASKRGPMAGALLPLPLAPARLLPPGENAAKSSPDRESIIITSDSAATCIQRLSPRFA